MELEGAARAVALRREDAQEVTALIRACALRDGGLAERTLERELP